MNFARLNHILIAPTKHERDRFRNTRAGRVFVAMFRYWEMFSTEGHFLLGFWLLGGLVSMNTVTRGYQLWSVITGALLAGVAMRGYFRLRGTTLQVVAPRRATVGEEVSLQLRLHNTGSDPQRAIRIERPFLPWDGSYVGPRGSIASLKPGERAERTVRLRFIARGEHHLDPFSVRALVPLGLTMGNPVRSDGTRLLVVPRIAPVSELRLPRAMRYQPGGIALASRTGESRELVGVRPYRPGDPVRDLHARSWARTGVPVVREYDQEYFTRIGVVVDTERDAIDEPGFEAALSLSAGLTAHLTRGEALIDLLVAGEHTLTVTLGRSLGFLEQALDLLACVEPGPTLEAAALQTRLQPHIARLSSVVLVVLRWDAQRAALRDWVLAQGAGCRVLLVESAEAATNAAPPDVTRVSTSQITSSGGLLL
ncbi:MAG TPA: DUF58 domain-containing protein [Polyangiales bacterium]|nr:DUF58 domain-containing protein [Polyangiales bacterium]